MNKDIIYKQNPVIRGHFLDDEGRVKMLSEFDFDVLNAIYLITQQSLFSVHPVQYKELIEIEISLHDIKKVLGIPKNKSYAPIVNAIHSLFLTEISLKDFVHPVCGTKYKFLKTRIINKYGLIDNYEDIYRIEINEIFLVNILRHSSKDKNIGNFTPVRIVNTRSLRSKHSKRLYEYLLSVKYKKNFSLELDELNKLFGVNYRSLYLHRDTLVRSYDAVNSMIQFNYEFHSRDKKISFMIIGNDKE